MLKTEGTANCHHQLTNMRSGRAAKRQDWQGTPGGQLEQGHIAKRSRPTTVAVAVSPLYRRTSTLVLSSIT